MHPKKPNEQLAVAKLKDNWHSLQGYSTNLFILRKYIRSNMRMVINAFLCCGFPYQGWTLCHIVLYYIVGASHNVCCVLLMSLTKYYMDELFGYHTYTKAIACQNKASWWCDNMKTLFALLALCQSNSLVTERPWCPKYFHLFSSFITTLARHKFNLPS